MSIKAFRFQLRLQPRLKRCQRAVSRKVKGSRNRPKAVDRLGRIHARIAAQRCDWLHQLSARLADSHPDIAIDDLKVAALSASVAGTVDASGKRVRQTAAQNILAAELAVWSGGTAACGADVSHAKRAAAKKQEPAEGWVHA